MNTSKQIAAFFDLDGVVLDTEPQYTIFWKHYGNMYRPDVPDFENQIKGMTLVEILRFFSDTLGLAEKIQKKLNEYECVMNYEYIPGVVRFIKEIRWYGVKTAVVTSSNTLKMENVYRIHPEFKNLFDKILTAENFKFSKPNPDCYLRGAKVFDADPENCFVFEDSFNGLEAGNRAKMCVVGLSTTNPANLIADKACIVIPNFENFNFEKMLSLTSAYCKKM